MHLVRSQGSSSSSSTRLGNNLNTRWIILFWRYSYLTLSSFYVVAQDKHSSVRSNSVMNNYRGSDHHKYSQHSSRDRENSNSNWNNRDGASYNKDEHYADHRVHENSSNATGNENYSYISVFETLHSIDSVNWRVYAHFSGVTALGNESQAQDMEISSENSTPTSEHYTPMVMPQQQLDVTHLSLNSSGGPGPPGGSLISSKLSHPSRTEVCILRTSRA